MSVVFLDHLKQVHTINKFIGLSLVLSCLYSIILWPLLFASTYTMRKILYIVVILYLTFCLDCLNLVNVLMKHFNCDLFYARMVHINWLLVLLTRKYIDTHFIVRVCPCFILLYIKQFIKFL